MRTLTTLLLPLLTTAALATTTQGGSTLTQRAEAAVRARLMDPYSARLRGQAVGANKVCGTVNARNAFGAYVGPQPFLYVEDPGDRYTVMAGDPLDSLIKTVCRKD